MNENADRNAEQEALKALTEALVKHPHSRKIVQAGLDAALDLLKAGRVETALQALDLLFRHGGNTPQFKEVAAYRRWVTAWLKARRLAEDATRDVLSYPLAEQALDGLYPIPEALEAIVRERVDAVQQQVESIEPLYYESMGDGLLASASVSDVSEARGSARLAAEFYEKARQTLTKGRFANAEEKLAALDRKMAFAKAMPEIPREGRVVIVQMTDGDKLDALLQAVQRLENEMAEMRARLDRLEGNQSYQGRSGTKPNDRPAANVSKWWETWG